MLTYRKCKDPTFSKMIEQNKQREEKLVSLYLHPHPVCCGLTIRAVVPARMLQISKVSTMVKHMQYFLR
jgi:hypothetical protein